MSSVIARKKRVSIGFTKKETEEIREFDAERKRLSDLSRCAYESLVAFKKAYALWYTTHLYVLHTIFKFSNKQISEYLEAVTDMLDTLCRYKQFSVTVPMMIETVQEETGVEVFRCM